MIRNGMVASHPAAAWAVRFFFWLAIVLLCGVALVGCSTFGIATEEYVEHRVESVDEKVTDAASTAAEPIDALFPGYQAFVRGAYTDRPIAPPPPPDTEIPLWVQAALAALGVPISVGVTNRLRDRKRVARGEALTTEEAVKKGYFEDGVTTNG